MFVPVLKPLDSAISFFTELRGDIKYIEEVFKGQKLDQHTLNRIGDCMRCNWLKYNQKGYINGSPYWEVKTSGSNEIVIHISWHDLLDML